MSDDQNDEAGAAMSDAMNPARVTVVMGVSGAGKSTVGRALAEAVGVGFLDADDLHGGHAKRAMAQGRALTDADREPWLDRVGRAAREREGGVVIACSALRRAYRDRLRTWVPGIRFVHLQLEADALRVRMDAREHEFMPSSLLPSQLQALEPLAPDERGVTISAAAPVDEIVARARQMKD